MFVLLKRDWLINRVCILTFFIVTMIGIVLPIEFLYLFTAIGAVFNLFEHEGKSRVNRYVLSLPINKGSLVHSRYAFISIMGLTFLLFQWGIITLVIKSQWIPGLETYVYQWNEAVLLFLVFIIIISLFIPIYYMFRSFVIVSSIQFLLLIIGIGILSKYFSPISFYFNVSNLSLIPLIEGIIPFQSMIFFVVISILIYFLSMKVSELIVKRSVI